MIADKTQPGNGQEPEKIPENGDQIQTDNRTGTGPDLTQGRKDAASPGSRRRAMIVGGGIAGFLLILVSVILIL